MGADDPPGPGLSHGPLPAPARLCRGLGWQVIDYLSALGILIVDVETHRLDEALGIARALVHPLKDSYIEVLVYFRAPGTELAAKRVQWTPASGYVELDIAVNWALPPAAYLIRAVSGNCEYPPEPEPDVRQGSLASILPFYWRTFASVDIRERPRTLDTFG